MVHLGDDFGEEFGLIGRKGLRVESSCGCGIIADSSQGFDVLMVSRRLDINSVYASISCLKAAAPIRLIEGVVI